jgi:hypothetical protein
MTSPSKMEIRLMLFKEIGFGISLNNQLSSLRITHSLLRKEESQSQFFLPQSKPNLHFGGAE